MSISCCVFHLTKLRKNNFSVWSNTPVNFKISVERNLSFHRVDSINQQDGLEDTKSRWHIYNVEKLCEQFQLFSIVSHVFLHQKKNVYFHHTLSTIIPKRSRKNILISNIFYIFFHIIYFFQRFIGKCLIYSMTG